MQAGTRRLSGAETAMAVVAAVLVLVFAVMLAMRVSGPGGQTPAAASGPQETTATSTAAEEEPATAGEDLSGVSFDFAAPSGNIACSIDAERALCGIADFSYADSIPSAEVAACEGTVGHFLQVSTEGAELVCDTSGQQLQIDTSGLPTLGYGQERTAQGFTCISSETGMSCTHDDTGSSFAVRRAAYDLS
ncbi:hypothetical protein [Georgenia yuyongxinii]|uniref:Uncharacterized protein n=1 Tax=Georgenia yuyongxinii TaxID=2589797 RepID=A0A552WJD7_9MICO|nr:hypothetical protein [Georgenia yuyongxinii]TRW42868.1 hypothetical protein FJ693_19905 [Georgenia yuyongxinii]